MSLRISFEKDQNWGLSKTDKLQCCHQTMVIMQLDVNLLVCATDINMKLGKMFISLSY